MPRTLTGAVYLPAPPDVLKRCSDPRGLLQSHPLPSILGLANIAEQVAARLLVAGLRGSPMQVSRVQGNLR